MKLTGGVDMKGVLKDIEQFSQDVQENIVNAINVTAINVENKAKRNAPVNLGRLRSSISTFQAKKEKAPLAEVVVGARYAPYVEFGTKSKVRIPSGLEGYASQFKGGSGSFEDLLANIKQWCRNKGIDEDAAFPIAVNIARNGVAPQPFLFPAVEEERPKFIKRLQQAINDTNK